MIKNTILRFLCLIGLLFASFHTALAQGKAAKAIAQVMDKQEKAWNTGSLEQFMEGYWHSDSLCFIGSRGLTHGWEPTLANYKKGYPNKDAMGTLTFSIVSVEQLSRKSAFVIGKWHLKRKNDELGGHYTLLWKKIRGQWVIVADHSS